jgi:ATP-dependent DNA helicase RecG
MNDRNIYTVEALVAYKGLQRLRDFGLLEQKGKGSATYYVPTSQVTMMALEAPLFEGITDLNPPQSRLNPPHNDSDSPHNGSELTHKTTEIGIPATLQAKLDQLGKRAKPSAIQAAILELCVGRELRTFEIASLLHRSAKNVQLRYIKPLIEQGILEYTHPENPAHPQQAYRTKV